MRRPYLGVLLLVIFSCGDDDVLGAPDAAMDAAADTPGLDAFSPDALANVPDSATDSATDSGPLPEIEVTYAHGTVVGRTMEGVESFLGLPYAAPPVGDLRWRAPAPVVPWAERRDASELPSMCPQVNALSGAAEGEEDCLYLSVFSPNVDPAADMPVYIWIHGGAFVFGSGGLDPIEIARVSGTVVVSINYRLAGFGFMAHPAFAAEGGGTGNYGFLDQRAVMQWVQDHITAFGGDSANVTIVGESAGAISVTLHALSPGSDGLFHRGIIESGVFGLLPTLEEAQEAGEALASSVGCADVDTAAACLRTKSFSELSQMAEPTPGGLLYAPGFGGPVFDGVTFVEQPLDAVAGGRISDVPLLIGTNGDEGTLFHAEVLAVPVSNEAEYRAALSNRYTADDVDAIVGAYPVASYANANAALSAATGEWWNCGTRRAARALTDAGVTVWLYAYEALVEGGLLEAFDLGSFHSSELVYLFDYDSPTFGRVPASSRGLQAAMQGYWTRFAAAGDPNGGEDPMWPEYEAESDRHMLLVQPPLAGANYLETVCDFWDQHLVSF